jgi:hypothetical protein
MRFESQFCRMNCQMFSWLLSSGARGGSGKIEMLLGILRSFAPCHPAWSRMRMAWAPGATLVAISSR